MLKKPITKLNNRGISLIELLAAIALLAIAGTVLFRGFTDAGRIFSKTTKLQMAEDVAQQVSEEFRSHTLDELYNSIYASAAVTKTDNTDPTTNIRTVTFSNIPCNYSVRQSAGVQEATFTANVTLTSLKTAEGVETVRTTTYKQHDKNATTGVYNLDSKTGVNTFIVPEVKNIYDGTNCIISDDINQYDNVVVDDLLAVIMNKISEKNEALKTVTGMTSKKLISESNASAAFEAMYVPLSNANTPNRLKKETTVKFFQQPVGEEIKYFYTVTVKYTFNFDFALYLNDGTSYGMLSSFLDSGVISSVVGAETTCEVKRSGTSYEVLYSSSQTIGSHSENCTFGGEITALTPEGTTPVIKNDGSGDGVPYFYILYKPFDLYTDTSTGRSTDKIIFNTSSLGTQNIVRAFLVVQEMKHVNAANSIATVSDFSYSGAVPDPAGFRFYTNSREIINKAVGAVSTGVNGDNYLTNSMGESHTGLYQMEITIFDKDGRQVATVNTVKED